ncbi:hypothetical protein O0L34_g2203 [Tuta absoluta]|nr:hypothetical protein O0L34_g2203 [Tuta absoluta]
MRVSQLLRLCTSWLGGRRGEHAMAMLDTLKNVGQERTCEYLKEKRQLQDSLATEEKEEKRLEDALHRKGCLIIEIKTALQQINQLLSSVGAPSTPQPYAEVPSAFQFALDDVMQEVPEVESDCDKLLNEAKAKLTLLMNAVAKIEVTKEVKAAAKQFYHNILAHSMRESFKEAAAVEGGLIEFEMEDPNVPSHAIIKLRSKQLVDAQVSEFDLPDKK